MIFSKEKWDDSNELKQFIPVSAALSFEKVGPSLTDAFVLFLVPLLGDTLTELLLEIYLKDSPESDEKKWLAACQRAVANLAFWYNFDELNVRITDQGIQRQESENFKSAYKYQEDNIRTNFKNKGFNALDMVIDFLDNHQEQFPAYTQCPAYTHRKNAIVQNTGEVDRIYFINRSHLIFLRLQPFFHVIEDTLLPSVLGTGLYEQLTKALKEGIKEIGSSTVEEFRKRCADFVVLKAISMLIRSTGSLTDRGLYFSQFAPGKEGNESRQPVDMEKMGLQLSQVESSAKDYQDILMTYIENNLPDLFKGRPSDALNRDNDHKKAFFA